MPSSPSFEDLAWKSLPYMDLHNHKSPQDELMFDTISSLDMLDSFPVCINKLLFILVCLILFLSPT